MPGGGPFQHPSVIQILGHSLWGLLATFSHKTCLIVASAACWAAGSGVGSRVLAHLTTSPHLGLTEEQPGAKPAPGLLGSPCVVQRARQAVGRSPDSPVRSSEWWWPQEKGPGILGYSPQPRSVARTHDDQSQGQGLCTPEAISAQGRLHLGV